MLGGVEDNDGTVSLSQGSKVIMLKVTAQDRQTTQTYTVTGVENSPATFKSNIGGAAEVGEISNGVASNITDADGNTMTGRSGATYKFNWRAE